MIIYGDSFACTYYFRNAHKNAKNTDQIIFDLCSVSESTRNTVLQKQSVRADYKMAPPAGLEPATS